MTCQSPAGHRPGLPAGALLELLLGVTPFRCPTLGPFPPTAPQGCKTVRLRFLYSRGGLGEGSNPFLA